LLLIDDIHAQQKFIRELMINSDGSDPNISKSFRKQADDLLKAGRLHEDYYYKLIY
jgi:defect-in-organelle-trafficking protein DotB